MFHHQFHKRFSVYQDDVLSFGIIPGGLGEIRCRYKKAFSISSSDSADKTLYRWTADRRADVPLLANHFGTDFSIGVLVPVAEEFKYRLVKFIIFWNSHDAHRFQQSINKLYSDF